MKSLISAGNINMSDVGAVEMFVSEVATCYICFGFRFLDMFSLATELLRKVNRSWEAHGRASLFSGLAMQKQSQAHKYSNKFHLVTIES